MEDIECKTQAELDAATQNGDRAVVRSGYFTASGSAQVTAFDSAQVTAFDSAQVRAYDSAQVRASGSAQVRASGSAQVTAFDSAQVTAFDSAQVRAGKWVAVTIHGADVVADGGVQIQVPVIASVDDWVEFYGVERRGDAAVVYKGVDAAWKSPRGATYAPGTETVAGDWDGGYAECGGGLHFSPRPEMTVEFFNGAARFVECEVPIADIAAPKADATYPQKIKARACQNIREVTINGKEVAP